MKVRLFVPSNDDWCANIIWSGKFPMRSGRFPANHPIGGGFCDIGDQCGKGDSIVKFRERGYWASCFPEGDGITLRSLKERTAEQIKYDVEECFGFEVALG